MNKRDKLAEARYFLGRLTDLGSKAEDLVAFRYELSACINAARSVAQYAYEEVKDDGTKKTWYEGAVAADPTIKFFKGKRDINIHHSPIGPDQTKVQIDVPLTVHVGVEASLTVTDADGNIIAESAPTGNRAPPRPEPLPSTESRQYFFSDWSHGAEDIVQLLERYCDALETFIDDGVKAGHITE